MNKYVERLYNGIIKENPTFVLMLGMCPTLAVTSSAINGLGMGLSTTVVLAVAFACARRLYPVDRCKLYYSGSGGELFIQNSRFPVHL